MASSTGIALLLGAVGAATVLGCDDGGRAPSAPWVSTEDTPEALARRRWVHEQTATRDWHLRWFLNGVRDIQYFEGWYDVEFDPERRAAWRWMNRRGIIRLRTRVEHQADFSDMTLTLHGWAPSKEQLGPRGSRMELAVNGHVLETLTPPDGAFEHTILVPKWLLSRSEFVDFTITMANTAHAPGDWRDLGFCTTGVVWKPSSAS